MLSERFGFVLLLFLLIFAACSLVVSLDMDTSLSELQV
jgi:hypothetical protein